MERRDRSASKTPLVGYAARYAKYIDDQRQRDADHLQEFRAEAADVPPFQDISQPVAGRPSEPVERARRTLNELVPLTWLETDWDIVSETDPDAESLLRLVPRFKTDPAGDVFLRVLFDRHLLLGRALGPAASPIYEAVRLRSPETMGYSEGVVRGPGCTREQVDEAIARALVPYLRKRRVV